MRLALAEGLEERNCVKPVRYMVYVLVSVLVLLACPKMGQG
jgi:hypothetical protein